MESTAPLSNLSGWPARRRALLRLLSIAALIGLLGWAVIASFFAVDVTEYGLVSRFGSIVRVVDTAGLHVKAPFDSVIRVDKRLTFSKLAAVEYLTIDKRNVVVESLASWRVADPLKFLAALATRSEADVRLGDVVSGVVGAVVGKHQSAAFIAADNDVQRFANAVTEIRERVAAFASLHYGMEVIDVKLLHLTLPEQNREHVFDRMRAERGKMAKEFRTAGELQSRKIIAEADRERTQIAARAYAQVQQLKAEGDAEAARIYLAAFSENPSFYKFLRTLQAYEKFLDEHTTLFLPADADVLRLLAQPGKPSHPQQPRANSVTAKSRDGTAPAPLAIPSAQGAGSSPPVVIEQGRR